MFDYSSILQSGMLWPSLILAVALTTARADTFSNLNSSCVVREGPCDINFRTEDGEPLISPIGTVNTTTLQQCASHCEVQVILIFSPHIHTLYLYCIVYVHIVVFRFLNQKYLGQRGLYCFPIKPGPRNMSNV